MYILLVAADCMGWSKGKSLQITISFEACLKEKFVLPASAVLLVHVLCIVLM